MIQHIDNNQVGYSASTTYNKMISAATIRSGSGEGFADNGGFSGDTVSLSLFKFEESSTYNSYGSVSATADAAYDILRTYVLDIFEKQGLSSTLAIGATEIDVNQLTQQDAQSLIAENGYFGIDQTSDRIVDFAIGIAGGDSSRIDSIMEGIERGFSEALDAFGGWLPDISYQTYDAVREKLDQWVHQTTTA